MIINVPVEIPEAKVAEVIGRWLEFKAKIYLRSQSDIFIEQPILAVAEEGKQGFTPIAT